MSRATDIEARAADWIAREDGEAWSQDDAAALRSWLDAATSHRVAYLRLRTAWDRADRLSALRAPSPPAPRRRHPGPRTGRMAAGVAAAAAAGLLIAGALVGRPSLFGPGQILSTPVGAQERIVLADGSKLELNSDTHVVADVTRTRRLVILKKGEAFFDVRHDPAHPFVVIAGDRRITDLGTRFSVRLDGGIVKVVVEQGRVRIDTTKPAPLAPTARLANAIEPQKAVVDQGGVAVAGDKAVLVVHQDTAQIARDLSWRYGLLNFNQTTLAEAADEFNRYNTRKLVVDGTAASIRIDGEFRSDNVAGFAHLLQAGFGLKVEESGDTIKISG